MLDEHLGPVDGCSHLRGLQAGLQGLLLSQERPLHRVERIGLLLALLASLSAWCRHLLVAAVSRVPCPRRPCQPCGQRWTACCDWALA